MNLPCPMGQLVARAKLLPLGCDGPARVFQRRVSPLPLTLTWAAHL